MLLALIECFFRLNNTHNFLAPRKIAVIRYAPMLNAQQVQKKYNFDILNIPKQYKASINPEIKNYQHSDIDYASKAPLQTGSYVSTLKLRAPNDHLSIYSANYQVNDKKFREVENNKKAKHFVLALGDSFTFGEGVAQGNDYPSQLSKQIGNDWQVYNYGISGAGTNDFIYSIQNDENFLKDIKEKDGIAIWYFIEDQYERFFCNLSCYEASFDQYIQFKPHYKFDGSDFIYEGKFNESRSPKRKFLQLLGQSEALKFSGVAQNSNYSKEQIEIFTKSFVKLSQEIKKKLQLKKFYVVVMQNFNSRDSLIKSLENEKELTLLDFSDIPHLVQPNSIYPLDGHPTSEYYWMLTQALKSKINFKEEPSN